MKKLFSFILITILVLSCFGLAACNPADDSGEIIDEDGNTVRVVKLWLHKSEAESEGVVYKALAENFNDARLTTADGKRVMVQLEFKNSSDVLATSIQSEILTGGLPDVVAVDAPNIAAYADAGILQSIQDYVSTEERASYIESVIEQSTIDSKLYALSAMDAPTGLYYNKTVLKTIGYTDADFGTYSDPWSYSDLTTAIAALKAAGKPYKIKTNLGFGGDEGCMYLYSPVVYNAGGLFSGSNGKATGYLNSAASLAGLAQFAELFKADNGSYIYSGTSESALAGSDVAFEVYGPWLVDSIEKNYSSFKNSYDIMPFPVYKSDSGVKGEVATGCGSWGFGVTTSAKNAEASALVVKYFTNKDASKLMYQSIGTFPTHKSLYSELTAFQSGPRKTFADLLTYTAKPRPIMVNYPKLSDEYSNIIEYIETMATSVDFNLSSYVTSRASTVDR